MKFRIAYFYPHELNLYGDTGNIEILKYRAEQRGFDVSVTELGLADKITGSLSHNYDLIFMGGGPDSSQQKLYKDLLENKGSFVKDYIEENGVALFICGSYQLLGHYYRSVDSTVADGSSLDIKGLSALDLYTVHFGHKSKRCVGNIVCNLDESILDDPVFKEINSLGNTLVGFENHGGQTFIGNSSRPFGQVVSGFGNNQQDVTEGIHYRNTIGTYMHGPLLSKNPHIADYLIAKALKHVGFKPLPIDAIIKESHTALIKRFSRT